MNLDTDKWFEAREARNVCSNGQSGTSSGSSVATIPRNISPLINQSAGYATQAGQMGSSGLYGQFGANPQQIAGLTPQQQSLIQQLINQGTSSPDIANARTYLGTATNQLAGANNELAGANDQLRELTGGPIGSSPATIAAMQAYNTNAVPRVQQALSLSGSGRGGNIADALTSSREEAYTPLVQQEIANRENAVNQYGSLANTLGGFANTEAGLSDRSAGLAGDVSNLKQTALNAAGMKQQNQQAQMDAAYQDLMRRFGLQQTTTLGPIQQILSSLLGQKQQNNTTNDPGALGYLGLI